MAGVVSVVLFEVCVLGVVKWRRRMKEPADSKEKEDVRFVSMILIIMQGNVQLSHDDVIDQRLGCAGKRVTSTAVTT